MLLSVQFVMITFWVFAVFCPMMRDRFCLPPLMKASGSCSRK